MLSAEKADCIDPIKEKREEMRIDSEDRQYGRNDRRIVSLL